MLDDMYSNLVSRNKKFISTELQNKIRKTRLVFFGVGLCSTVVESCVRLGFENIYIQDGDIVEHTNLNRQNYHYSDIGCYKVDALAQRIKSINNHINLDINQSYVNSINEVASVINDADIIINTVDCSQIYYDIIEYAQKNDKLVLCPFNLGYGALLLSFNSESGDCWSVFDVNCERSNIAAALQLFEKYPDLGMLEALNVSTDDFCKLAEEQSFIPQINVGANVICGMISTTLIKYINGQKIILAPKIYKLSCQY